METCCNYFITDAGIGKVLLAWHDDKVTDVILGTSDTDLLAQLQEKYSPELLIERPATAMLDKLASYLNGDKNADLRQIPVEYPDSKSKWSIDVWNALREIPAGSTKTYGELAQDIGASKDSSRAVGRACASNDIAVLVPCHRVLSSQDSDKLNYRWGREWKEYLLQLEQGADN